MKLTTLAARTIQPGQVLKCDVVPGLELWGKPSGAVWFFYYRTAAGQRRRPKVGNWPALQIEAAREAARKLALAVAMGADPSAERAQLRAAATVDDLFAAYQEHTKDALREASLDADARNYRLHVKPHIGAMKAEAVRLADLDRLLAAAADPRPVTRKGHKGRGSPPRGGPVVANRVRALLSAMLNYAERDGVNARPRGSNPIRETRKNSERRRKRRLERDEFARVAAELDKLAPEMPRHVAAIWCTLYTGARVSELPTARRDWLNGDVLTLAVHKTMATGNDRLIRLPRQALDILAALPDDGSGLLFGAGLDRFAIWDAWKIVRDRAGCPDVQPRDLRRTFASVAVSHGASLDQIGEAFSHASAQTTKGYAYLSAEAAETLVQTTADQIDALTRPKGPPEPLR